MTCKKYLEKQIWLLHLYIRSTGGGVADGEFSSCVGEATPCAGFGGSVCGVVGGQDNLFLCVE
jgi:hypothetical protein